MSDQRLSIGSFDLDATPDIGDPIEYGLAEAIDDPLSCRGVVLLGAGQPIVLAAIDWLGNSNSGYDLWRHVLADAIETSPSRIAVHTVHQHEAPGFDLDSIKLLSSRGISDHTIDDEFAFSTINRAADSLREAAENAAPVTHVGLGEAEVQRVASNRQLLNERGGVFHVRYSAEPDHEARALPEGLIDPRVRLISFWNNDTPLVSLSYYATHPQSYYRNRHVTSDFVGLARDKHEAETSVPQIHFTGAAGNITAGKYNDGSERMRDELADRLTKGMARAWEDTTRTPVEADDVMWRSQPVGLPVADRLNESDLREALHPASGLSRRIFRSLVRRGRSTMLPLAYRVGKTPTLERLSGCSGQHARAARDLAWLKRRQAGKQIPVSGLRINDITLLHLPGEPFVEYQLAANELRSDQTVAVAAYGDLAPRYIGTRDAYTRGGYEVATVSNVSSAAEEHLFTAMADVLSVADTSHILTPSDITRERKPRISASDADQRSTQT